MVISKGPNKSRTKFFKIKAIVPKKKIFAIFFWSYPLWQTSAYLLLCSTRYFGRYGISYKILSLTPKNLLKTQSFEKKKANFPVKKSFLPILPALSSVTNLKVNLWGSTRCSDNYCESYKIISVTSKVLLETQFFEKRKVTLPVKKRFGVYFAGIIECDKPQGWVIRVQQFSDNYWGSCKIISVTPERLLRTKNFEKKAIFPVKKRFLPIFSRIIECNKPQGTK